MTNPFHNSPSSFGTDQASFPAPTSQRRSSYASVASGAAALSRTSRPSAFYHLLNPSSDSETYNNLYSTSRNSRFDMGMAQGRNGTSGEDSMLNTAWQPRLGTGLPWYSRAFDHHMSKEPLFPGTPEDGFGSVLANSLNQTFLSPSYLRGFVYLQRLEAAHKAKLAAEREGLAAAKAQVGGGLANNGNGHAPTAKLPSGSHRGVQFEIVEKTTSLDEDSNISPLPTRWNREDKDPSLEVLGDGFEVKHTGRSSSEHEACAIRADHHMPTLCGVYYFEVIILNKKREE